MDELWIGCESVNGSESLEESLDDSGERGMTMLDTSAKMSVMILTTREVGEPVKSEG